MPWIDLVEHPHRCSKPPLAECMDKLIGSQWQCETCDMVWMLTLQNDPHGSFTYLIQKEEVKRYCEYG